MKQADKISAMKNRDVIGAVRSAMESYLFVITKSATGFAASSPDVSGCIATGPSVEKVATRMKKALRFHLEGLAEEGDPLPPAKGAASHRQALKEFAGCTFFLTYVAIDLSQIQQLAHAK